MLDRVSKPEVKQKRSKGYDILVGSSLDRQISALAETNLAFSISYALSYHVRFIALWALAYWAMSYSSALVFAVPILWIWTASCQRGFENLVHDGSHFNWARRNKACNDFCVNILVAWAVFQDVKEYRGPHLRHHQLFDTEQDPCRGRWIMGRLRRREGDTVFSRAFRLAPHLIELNREFFRSQLQRAGWASVWKYIVWHTVAYFAPLVAIVGFGEAAALWVVAWAIPQVLVLPIIRALAEGDEHDYDREGNELDATFTNESLVSRWLIHPAGDAYHAAHHDRMSVPAYRMKKLDRLLNSGSRAYQQHPRRD